MAGWAPGEHFQTALMPLTLVDSFALTRHPIRARCASLNIEIVYTELAFLIHAPAWSMDQTLSTPMASVAWILTNTMVQQHARKAFIVHQRQVCSAVLAVYCVCEASSQ